MSDDGKTIDNNGKESSKGAEFAEAFKEAMAPLYEQNRQIIEFQQQQMQQRQAQQSAPAPRMPTAADYGIDADDPYNTQFSSLIRELASMKAENNNLRDQVQNLGVTTMQSQLGKQVKEALETQKVPLVLHDQASAIIYSVLSSGQQTTPEAIASNFMEGINVHSDNVRKNVAEQATRPGPPTFRGQEFGPESKEAESMEEAHEMFAEIADSILQGATLESLSEAEG